MRLPRHVTSVSLSAEPAAQALARDEALLDAADAGQAMVSRWYIAQTPAVVLGLGLWRRRFEIVDEERCRQAGVEVLERRAGGGALLLDDNMLCAAVCVRLPDERAGADLTESYRWLGDRLTNGLHTLGVRAARRVEIAEARMDTADLKTRADPLLNTCFGCLSPHEVVIDGRKLIGLAQLRRRHAALFQIGILLRDQAPLARLLRHPELAPELRRRTVGVADLLPEPLDVTAIAGTLEHALRA